MHADFIENLHSMYNYTCTCPFVSGVFMAIFMVVYHGGK